MATSRTVIDNLSRAAAGIRHTTLVHTARLLREAGGDRWPQSGRGGGKNARHVEPGHFANLILALAAAQPSEAVDAATKLGAARWTGEGRAGRTASTYDLSARALLAHRQDGRSSRDLDLHGMLVLLLRRVAESRTADSAGRRGDWTLWLNSDLGTAWVAWTEWDKEHREHKEWYEPPQPQFFATGQRSQTAVERFVKIPFALIAAAAALCVGTPIRSNPERPPSSVELRKRVPPRPTHRGERPPPAAHRDQPGRRRTTGGRGASPKK